MVNEIKNKIYNFGSYFADILFRIYRVAGRLIIKYSSNSRPDSYPFITSDGFRDLANHVYDDFCKDFIPEKVKYKEIVFVGDENIEKFLVEIHPKIKANYILITNNGDNVINQKVFDLAKDKILKWYGINVLISDPRVIPIPLGIENKHYYVCGIPAIFNMVIKKNFTKKNRIFYGFSVFNNKEERQPAMDVLKINPLSETFKRWMNFYQYLNLLATYKFVASPPGSSVEGHRTWDALYIGIIPIVKSSITTDYFEKIGVPLWVVKDWHELDSLTEKNLAEKFENIKKNSKIETIYMDYWIDKIKNVKD